jgi:ankyrin repeat protein
MADNQGQIPLMHAVKNGHQDVATVVLSYGADVNRKDAAGKTPVQVATDLKKQNLVTLLTRPKTSVGLQRSKNPAAR